MQETPVQFLGQEDPLEKGKATHSSILGLLCGSAGKESACSVGDLGSIPGLGRSPGTKCGDSPWWSSDYESTFNVGDLGSIPGLGRSPGEGKGIHSGILAWRIPWVAKWRSSVSR